MVLQTLDPYSLREIYWYTKDHSSPTIEWTGQEYISISVQSMQTEQVYLDLQVAMPLDDVGDAHLMKFRLIRMLFLRAHL